MLLTPVLHLSVVEGPLHRKIILGHLNGIKAIKLAPLVLDHFILLHFMYITVYGVFMANASKQTFVFLIVSVTSISNGSLLYQGCTVLMSPASPVFHTEATVNIADIK